MKLINWVLNFLTGKSGKHQKKIFYKKNPDVKIIWSNEESSKLQFKKLIGNTSKNIELISSRCIKISHTDLVKKDNEKFNLGDNNCKKIHYNYFFTGKDKEIHFYLILEKKNFKLKEEIEAILNSVSLLD